MNKRYSAIALAMASVFSGQVFGEEKDLGQVVVTATRQATRTNELLSDVSVIERKELEQAGQTTVAELLARQPGVEYAMNGSPGSSTSVYLRGGANAKHTVVLIDGMRVGSASLGEFSWSRLPANQVERIEILRGPASSLYGSDAIGGVIQIFTRRGDGTTRPNLELAAGSYDTRSVSGGVAGGANGWRYSLQGSHYKTDGFNNRISPAGSSYNPDLDGFENNSGTASVSYALAKGHEIGLNAFHTEGINLYDGSPKNNDYRAALTVINYGAYLKDAFTDFWTSTVRLGQSADKSTNLTNGAPASQFNTTQEQYSWQNDLKTPIGLFMVAVERLQQHITTATAYTLKDRTIDSAVLGWNKSLGDHRLQASVRRDENTQFGGKNTGSVSYGYQFNRQWRASASYGTAFKAPSFNDLYYPLDAWGYVGNPGLKPESARNKEASLHYDTGSHLVSLTWFSNKIDDLISWSGRTSPINIGKASLSGATLAYTGQVGSFQLSANLTHQEAKDVDTGRWIARRAANYGTVAVGQKVGPWEWHTELYGAGSRYDQDNNQLKLGGYGLLNLYGSYRVAPEWSVFARANNVLDKKYELASDYTTPGFNIFAGVRYSPK